MLELDQSEDPSAAGLAGDLEVPAHVGGQREAESEADGAGGGERLLVPEQQLHRVVVRRGDRCKGRRSVIRNILWILFQSVGYRLGNLYHQTSHFGQTYM